MRKKNYWLLAPIVILVALGGWNIARRIGWQEPTDGVVWKLRPEGLTAVKLDPNGPAYLYGGVKKGDVLLSIDENRIRTKIDLVKQLWIASRSGRKVTYQISRGGYLLPPTLTLAQKGTPIYYYYLALIGLMTLIIALIVFFNSGHPLAATNIYYYLLSVLLYMFYVFSATGELDAVDSVFYWLDKIAFCVFPPLLLHFFLIFPQRKKVIKDRPGLLLLLYIPGLLLLLARALFFLPLIKSMSDALVLQVNGLLAKLDLFHFALYTTITLATIAHSYFRHPSFLVRKQLKWIVTGLGFGVVPFTILYIVPFLADQAPSQVGELTILLQTLIPLSFAYSISRYKLMDLEVILKKAATLVFSYFVLALVYLVVSSQTRIFVENRVNALGLGVVALILGATLFGPLKKLFQSLFDRVLYRRSYEYRRTLLSISRELSRERNMESLAQSLLEHIGNALSLRTIALLLPAEADSPDFVVLGARGGPEALPARLRLDPEIHDILRRRDSLSLFGMTERRELQIKFEQLSSYGFEHFLALKVEGKLVGCLAMGKKADTNFLSSEDWELLTTISSPVALAVENATLYQQAGVRTAELERLKDYSENIIESLTVGVTVLDTGGRIIGWNRVMEGSFGLRKAEVIGRRLSAVLDPEAYAALYPTSTQEAFNLLSEIPIGLPSGEKRIFDVAKTPLLDNRLAPYGTIIVFEDVTDKIKLQQQLVTSEKLASIGLLSAGVAHEINTPLTGISSYVQMLQKNLTDTHLAQVLGKIEAQTDRVSRIIKNLLSFARNPSDLAFHRVDLKDSLQEILSLIDYKLKTMSIVLDLDLAPVRPIWAQGERLQQVFINIILNALDAMPEGGRLRISLAETEAEAVIEICDSGSGIEERHLARIFDPFFTTKGVGKGTGLGLSISHAIITEHEGRIAVRSASGQGTCFSISIPKDLDRRRRGLPKPDPTSSPA
ncbi:MAG: ATP-binding protein [Candidatus Aminicenantes bacterium]|nr:ATP-binding protein [Candidatus Aminicenantes bacterium]